MRHVNYAYTHHGVLAAPMVAVDAPAQLGHGDAHAPDVHPTLGELHLVVDVAVCIGEARLDPAEHVAHDEQHRGDDQHRVTVQLQISSTQRETEKREIEIQIQVGSDLMLTVLHAGNI